MVNLLRRPFVVVGAVLSTGMLVWSQTYTAPQPQPVPQAMNRPQPMMAGPGTVNYVEGQANIDGRAIPSGAQSMGSRLEVGQTLATGPGSKAEVLMMPGVVLRIGDNSAVRMVSSMFTNAQVELTRGTALVEVSRMGASDRLVVSNHGANIMLNKKGLYSFNADQPSVAVYEGKAEVQLNDRSTDVSKGEQLALVPGVKLKTTHFDRKMETELYDWSLMRSQQMAQMAVAASPYVVGYSPYYAGWYWSPYYSSWLWGPWGYGLGFGLYGGGFWGGYPGFYHGYYGYGHVPAFRGGYAGGFHGGFAGGGFHGGGGFGGGGRR
jgi:FecR protein